MRSSNIVAIAVVTALALAGPSAARGRNSEAPALPAADNPEDLQVVDCLLPGQLRRLGAKQTYLSRRQPARTTALDCQIRGGEYVAYDRANYQTALRVWLEAAEEGDPRAQYFVGEIYQRGLGAEPDFAKAAEWYRRAADQGYGPAQTGLGFLYEKGLGVPADARVALDWYRKAAGVSGVIMLDSELAAMRQELARVHAQLADARSASQAVEQELRAAREEIDREHAAGRDAEEQQAALRARVSALERRLEDSRGEIERFEAEQRRYDVAGPSIEIIDTSAKRSLTAAESPSNGDIVGRVEAPAGLASLHVDAEKVSVEDGGLFRFRPRSDRMKLVAVDLQGKRCELMYTIGERGESATGPGRSITRTKAKFGSYHALLIGNSDYTSLPRVETADADVTALAALLEEHFGFSVTTLRNATYLDVLAAFSTLMKELGEKDNLLLYYAGHGELDNVTGLGYWLPVDTEKDRKTNWISSREISVHLEMLPPAHILVVADSCYSGALTQSSLVRFDAADEKERSRWIKELAGRRSRTALTSGGLQPVLDAGGGGHSIFARALLDALGEADDALPTYSLWSAVKARVMVETRWLRTEQVPEYAPIQYAGHESGEFFFVPALH